MAPILGIYASQISGHLSTNNFSSIATVTVGSGGTSTVTFSSIPSTYTHLQLRAITRSTSSAGSSGISYGASGFMTFNGDTGSYYNEHYLLGDGASASAGAIGTLSSMLISDLGGPYATQTANAYSASIIDILDYTSNTKNKTIKVLNGQDRNGAGRALLQSGFWFNPTPQAINSITILEGDSANFAQYSTFALYGIR